MGLSPGTDWVAEVRAFHRRFGIEEPPRPAIPETAAIDTRLALVAEELCELCVAFDAGDLVEVADALADLVYVLVGTAWACGVDLGPVFAEVHRTNMTKATPVRARW